MTTTDRELFPGANKMSASNVRHVLRLMAETGRVVVPPVNCYSFCSEQDGHPGQLRTDDQTCYGPDRHIPTVMYPPQEVSRGRYVQNYFSVYVAATHNGERPTIHLSVGETAGIVMSIDEALAVARAIVSSVDEASSAGI